MAASPAFAGLKSLRAVTVSAAVPSVHESPVVRTAIHAAPAGTGTRSISRRITPEAGFALEKLGHAIEYLADEYVHEVGRLPVASRESSCIDPQVQAMQMLMAANREVYYACPVVTPLYQRFLKRFFGR
jgi:hypothetical protein